MILMALTILIFNRIIWIGTLWQMVWPYTSFRPFTDTFALLITQGHAIFFMLPHVVSIHCLMDRFETWWVERCTSPYKVSGIAQLSLTIIFRPCTQNSSYSITTSITSTILKTLEDYKHHRLYANQWIYNPGNKSGQQSHIPLCKLNILGYNLADSCVWSQWLLWHEQSGNQTFQETQN
jgi:hypothetical protein